MISNELNRLIALAVAAGREIMAVQDAGFDTVSKADGSPVTIADQRAEAVILAGLAVLAPGVPVLAEEESAAGRTPVLGSRFFCVDPLDGTKDFVAGGNGEFTVNIALVEDGIPTTGVVFAPAKMALYAAEPGIAVMGAWDPRTQANLHPLASIRVAPRDGAWRVTASRRHGAAKLTDGFIAALGGANETPSSSSVKFCLIAEGRIDLYPRFGNVCEWDAAAGHAVLRAAGGGVMRLDGEPVIYGRVGKDFIIDGFVAYGDAGAEREARRILKSLAAQ